MPGASVAMMSYKDNGPAASKGSSRQELRKVERQQETVYRIDEEGCRLGGGKAI